MIVNEVQQHLEHRRIVEEEDRRRWEEHQRRVHEEAERENERRRNEENHRRWVREEAEKAERKRNEEEKRRNEEEKIRIAEEKKRFEEERKRTEEKSRIEEEARRIEAEAIKKANDDEKKRNEEQKQKNEEQERKTEEEARANEERKIKLEEEAKANEEEARANEEEAKANEERKRELEEEARKIKMEMEIAEEKSRVDREARELAENESARYKLDLENGIQPIKWPTKEEVSSIKSTLQYREDHFHFAITGTAGSGKSSLINAFRGIKNNEAGAASVGVTETTQEIGRYPDPDNTPPRAWTVWFDVPGAGTPKIPDWQYFNQQGLFIFDLIIVAVDARLTKIDISILENCRRFKIPSFIVRSKANQHIQNVMQDMSHDSDDEDEDHELRTRARMEYIKDTHWGFESVLREASLPPQKTYIVSNTTICALIKAQKMPKDIIDEVDLIKDLLLAAHRRRYPDQEA